MPSRVALVAGPDRYDNLVAALTKLRGQVPRVDRYLIKPNLVSATAPAGATHPEGLRAVIDFLRSRGPCQIVIAEGNSEGQTWQAFENLGYLDLARQYPEVSLADLNEAEAVPLTVWDVKGRPLTLRLARRVVESPCRISLTLPKTHDTVLVSLALKNLVMGSLLGPPPKSASGPWGQLFQLAKRLVPPALKKYLTLAVLIRCFGPNFFPGDKVKVHQGYANAHFFIAQLAVLLPPHLAVIDGFTAMEGDGPVYGTALPLGLAAAGTDAVAVDATLARLMGLDPREIGYLAYAARLGLGTLKAEEIEVLGPALADCRRAFKLHSTSKRQREWHSPEAETLLTRIRPRLAPGPSSNTQDFPPIFD
jgi:uncharacterized protein (DUF362 family)